MRVRAMGCVVGSFFSPLSSPSSLLLSLLLSSPLLLSSSFFHSTLTICGSSQFQMAGARYTHERGEVVLSEGMVLRSSKDGGAAKRKQMINTIVEAFKSLFFFAFLTSKISCSFSFFFFFVPPPCVHFSSLSLFFFSISPIEPNRSAYIEDDIQVACFLFL